MKVICKPVSLEDLRNLREISERTFTETFAEVNTAENMRNYLEKNFNEAALSEQINNIGSRFYLAQNQGKTIGYLKLNSGTAQNELLDHQAFEIERIYVLREFHGKDIGLQLLQKALEEATRASAPYIWLGVWEKNDRAISFYKKHGFIEFDKHIFRLGEDEQTDLMMKLILNKNL